MNFLYIILIFAASLVGVLAGWLIARYIGQSKVANAEKQARQILEEARKEAGHTKREKILEAKDEIFQLKQKFETENKRKRDDLQRIENKVISKERNLEKQLDVLKKKEDELQKRDQKLNTREARVEKLQKDLDHLIERQNEQLEKISGISNEEAKRIQMNNLLEKAKQETAREIKSIKDLARQTANREAREIIIQAIQRTAADHSTETTVSVVNLPNDEMKGRIIGREGRNIRSFETATGVEVIVDDTPEAVVLSGFDPFRREIAKVSLEKLVSDGRIHPSRIEEVVNRTTQEMEENLIDLGEKALFETGVSDLHIELKKYLGKLKYRTSYGQNVYQHAIEVSYLSGLIASQLGLDGALAKRAGLLHDIGKAIDRYTEGTHSEIGGEIARKYGENEIVVNSILAHHEDVEATHPISVLVKAADAISGSRPGARRETLETYIKRLESLETLAKSFSGVGNAYAIQAGREIRVIVEHEKMDDAECGQLSSDIAEKIQSEMEYPGQIKVTVIREYRAIEYAK